MSRYGGAIEADLRDIDIADLWARRRWRRLLNLIDHLPVGSFYVEAQADDDEVARLLVNRPQEERVVPPRLSEWGPVREELVIVADRLGELIALFVSANGGGKVKLHPRPRPVTALDRARVDQRLAKHQALVERLIPKPES